MQTRDGEIIEENDKRDTRRLRLGDQVLYLKRIRTEKTSSALESYARGRLAHSKPFKEMLHFRHLAEHGFEVAEVVAVGEELSLGIPRSGFIITAEVSGQDLSGVYRVAGTQERRRILGWFGTLLGRLHDHGFFGSTRLKDIFFRHESGQEPRLVLIDREVRNPYPKRVTEDRILSRLLINIRRQIQQGEDFDESEWREFAETYCASLSGDVHIEAEPLLAKIRDLRQHPQQSR